VSDDLIPRGWKRVRHQPVQSGDKYWVPELLAWLPVTANSDMSGQPADKFLAVIRKDE
jgi:hypothetical protein